MNLKQKWHQFRPMLNNGDIMLIRGNSLLARAINWGDAKDGKSAYWNHALMIYIDGHGNLLAIESEAKGVEPDYLDQVVLSSLDFCIVRPKFPQAHIDECEEVAFNKGGAGIPYDYWLLPKILFYRKLGFKVKKDNPTENICSVFAARTYGGLLPLTCYSEQTTGQLFVTPQDLIRFADEKEVQILAMQIAD